MHIVLILYGLQFGSYSTGGGNTMLKYAVLDLKIRMRE